MTPAKVPLDRRIASCEALGKMLPLPRADQSHETGIGTPKNGRSLRDCRSVILDQTAPAKKLKSLSSVLKAWTPDNGQGITCNLTTRIWLWLRFVRLVWNGILIGLSRAANGELHE